MITIISATNRPNSNSLKVAQNYLKLLEKKGLEPKLLSLESLPADFIVSDLYNKRSENFQQLLSEYIMPAQKIIFVVPEYNGSFPGVLKTFIDSIHPDVNRGKKILLVGVATGRAGNLRGMEHLTGVLNYLGMYVHPNRLPISLVSNLLDDNGVFNDVNTIQAVEKQIAAFVDWNS